jgi:hypothetical protein
VPGRCGTQETEPDTQEGAHQHEVGELGEVDDVRAEPADQGELEE